MDTTNQQESDTNTRDDDHHSDDDDPSSTGVVVATLACAELVVIVFLAAASEYEVYKTEAEATLEVAHYYPLYQDINVMIFVGFGFLMTFLKSYNFSALAFTMLLASITSHMSLVVNHLMHCLFAGAWSTLKLNIVSLITANFASGAILVSFGAVLGRASLLQLVVMAVSELWFYALNENIGLHTLEVVDMGGSMFVHAFGAFFGLAFSFAMREDSDLHEHVLERRSSDRKSDIFAMIGTMFLFMFWPSFNGALADGSQKHRVVINTMLAITGSCVSAVSSSLLVGGSRLDMVHVQNAVLAGGVAVGSACDLVIRPWAAVLTGLTAGVVSVVGYHRVTPFLECRTGLLDTCGVLNLHGIPGIVGAVSGALSAALSRQEEYETSVSAIWPARSYRSGVQQCGYQLLAAVVTVSIACAGGFVTGRCALCVTSKEHRHYIDGDAWKTD